MAVLVLDPSLPEVQSLLERRRISGIDRYDEVWDGVLHLSPHHSSEHARLVARLAEILAPLARAAGLEAAAGGFNLGLSREDYRVPDGGLLRPDDHGLWLATAALVMEIVSPYDESWQKLPFYAAHEVNEVLILDPGHQRIDWLGLRGGRYEPIIQSGLVRLGPAELADELGWPCSGNWT